MVDYLLVGVVCVAEGDNPEAIVSGKTIRVLAWRDGWTYAVRCMQ